MSTQVSIVNHGPYVITMKVGSEPEVVIEPGHVVTRYIWEGTEVQITEPEGSAISAEYLEKYRNGTWKPQKY